MFLQHRICKPQSSVEGGSPLETGRLNEGVQDRATETLALVRGVTAARDFDANT